MSCCQSCAQGRPCESTTHYHENPAPLWIPWAVGIGLTTLLGGGAAVAVAAHKRKQAELLLQQQQQAALPPPDPKRSIDPMLLQADKLALRGVQTLKPGQTKVALAGNMTVTATKNPWVITLSQEETSARSLLDALKKDGTPLTDMRVKTVYLHTWQDVEELATMMQTLLIHSLKPTKEGAEMAQYLRSFFLRNRWNVPTTSEVYQDQKTVLDYLTPKDGREVIDAAIWVREQAWAGEVATSNDYIPKTLSYIQELGCIPKWFPPLTEANRDKAPHVLSDGLLLIFEHALIKTANFLAVMMANPKAVPGLEAKLLSVASPLLIAGAKVGIAAAIGGASAASAAVPVAGWITAAVGAIAAGVAAFVELLGSWNNREEANLKWQETLQNAAEELWTKGFNRLPLRESLLGYQLNLISEDPAYTVKDARSRYPWLRNFCLVRGGSFGSPCSERIFPQIPFLVRQIKQPAVVQFGIGKDALRMVSPTRAWMGPNKRLIMGWQLHEVEFEKIPNNLGFLGVA
ncbi:MAG: hypothetical protein H6727_09350 [Myxococcales bacterium]|nr:hypothetical protein [Myxococcales bacterium]